MDPFIEVMDAVRSSGYRFKTKGDNHCSMQCPAHNGNDLNLAIDYKNGKVLFKCLSHNCKFEDIIASLGLKKEKDFAEKPKTGVCVKDVSISKRLPIDLLEACGWRDSNSGKNQFIRISYGEGRGRTRRTLHSKEDKFKWDMREEEKNKTIRCYKPKPFSDDMCFIVEGETDVCTLVHHGYNALGVPGAMMYGKIHHSDLEGINKVFIVAEGDPAGQLFGENVSLKLRSIRFRGTINVINMGRTEYNDINEIHCKKEDSFKSIIQREMECADETKILDDDYQVVSDDKTFHVFSNKIVYLEMKTIKGEIVEIPRNILNQRVIVEDIHKDIFTDECIVTLRWGKNERKSFGADILLFGKNHSELAKHGIFIDSNNQNYMASYFRAAISKIATKKSSSRNGWKGDAFIYGDRILSPRGSEKIEFEAVGYCPTKKGEKSEQIKAINELIGDTQIALKAGASAISPLVEKIGCDNFIFHSWGDSSRGKTTGSRIGASFYARPTRILDSWKSSMAGIETIMDEAGGLPIFLEESHKGKRNVVVDINYSFPNKKPPAKAQMNNGSRSRRKSPIMLGVIISTGESEMSSLTNDGGAVARLLEQHKVKVDEDGYAEKIEKCMADLEENHGHLGELIFEEFFKRKHEIIANFENFKKKLRETSLDGLQYRQTPYFAASLAGCEVLRSLGVNMPSNKELIECCIRTMSYRPKGLFEKAIEYLLSCADVNKNSFVVYRKYSKYDGGLPVETEGFFDEHIRGQVYGMIDEVQKEVHIYPKIFKNLLDEEGMNVQSVKKAFQEKGILRISTKGELTNTKRIYGQKRRVVTFSVADYLTDEEEDNNNDDPQPPKPEPKQKEAEPEQEILAPYLAKGYGVDVFEEHKMGIVYDFHYEEETICHKLVEDDAQLPQIASEIFEAHKSETLERKRKGALKTKSVVTKDVLMGAETSESSLFELEETQYEDERGM